MMYFQRATKALLTLGACLLVGAAHAAPTAQEILAASDLVRNPDFSFGITNTLIEYRGGKQTDTSTLAIYSKADTSSGQFRSLVRFVAPARDANKLMLYSGKDLWFYDPTNKASVRLSPQQRLLGQASNGDVLTVNLARDYQATQAGEEDMQDGEKKMRRCYKLTLNGMTDDVNYHHIEIWIDTTNKQPIKARYYAESGKLLKTAYFRRFENHLGQDRPTETVIIDGLDPSWVTVMRFSNYAKREVPDAWLQRDYLPRFKAE